MIQTSTAFAPQTAGEETGYKAWQTSMGKVVMRLDPTGRTAGPIPTFGRMVQETALSAQGAVNAYAPSPSPKNALPPDIAYQADQKEDQYSFSDVIDMINPLQHLPVIGTIYRKITGDSLKPMSNIIGGALFGGPVGAVASTANVVLKDRTGKDMAENVFSIAGFDAAPQKIKTPEIVYETQDLPGTTLAVANLSAGAKNFGAQAPSQNRWNS